MAPAAAGSRRMSAPRADNPGPPGSGVREVGSRGRADGDVPAAGCAPAAPRRPGGPAAAASGFHFDRFTRPAIAQCGWRRSAWVVGAAGQIDLDLAVAHLW